MIPFKEYYLQTLEELFVHGNMSNGKYTNIIAYGPNVWLFQDAPISAKEARTILETIGIAGAENYNSDGEDTDKIASHELKEYIRDAERADVLTGVIKDNILFLDNSFPYSQDPKSSLLIKKVVNKLKLKSVNYEDGIDSMILTNVKKNKITGNIPDFAYHGTSLKYLESILKNGIEPRYNQSNYKHANVYHDESIFFATKFGDAAGHAVNAAHNTKSKPMVIEFRIPDKNLLIPDYDIDMLGGRTHFEPQGRDRNERFGSEKSFSLTKSFGVYGYHGKILPQHIKYIYIGPSGDTNEYTIDKYKRFTPKQIRKYIDRGYELEYLNEVKIEPEIQNQAEFNTITDINPKEKINNEFSIRFEETKPDADGSVLIYENTTGKIATRMFWSLNDQFGILTPQVEMVMTNKDFAGKGLSLLAYKELIDRYTRLLSDQNLSVASLNNWSKKIYNIYKNSIFTISDTEFEPWDGDINKVVNTEKQFIILTNSSDIKRLNRKYN